jgi:hypothetical protein
MVSLRESGEVPRFFVIVNYAILRSTHGRPNSPLFPKKGREKGSVVMEAMYPSKLEDAVKEDDPRWRRIALRRPRQGLRRMTLG